MTGELQVIAPAAVALIPLGRGHLVPALIAQEGERAGWRYVEFFTANIPEHAPGLCPRLHSLLRLVRES